jgi:hypothetical protein
MKPLLMTCPDDAFDLQAKCFIDVFGFHLRHAVCTEAVVIVLLYIAPLICRKDYSGALAAADIAHPALKGYLAAGAVFIFVCAAHLNPNISWMRRDG